MSKADRVQAGELPIEKAMLKNKKRKKPSSEAAKALPRGAKVIVQADEPMPQKLTKKQKKAWNTARTRAARDIQNFGEEHTTTEAECTAAGHIVKKRQKVGKMRAPRDLCLPK